MTRIQVFKREFHTHIYLNYIRVEFLSCINKKNLKKNQEFNVIKLITPL